MRFSEDVVVFEGDSLTFLGRMQERMENLRETSDVYNVATGGNTIQNITAQAATEVDSLYDETASNRLFLWIGVNNLLDGSTQTPQEVLDEVWGYVAARQALGWNVTISTLPQADGAADADKVLEYNNLIREQWHLYADELIDVAADERFQDHNNSTYFSDDHLHLTYEGSEAIADLIDARYLPAQAEKQTLLSYDAGEFSFGVHYGATALLSSGGAYQSGAAILGALWYELDGTAHRITYNDLGVSQRLDVNGDGSTDILSIDGTYSTGQSIGGAVWYDTDAGMHRITYNHLGEYTAVDFDGDGEIELISNNGSYSDGTSLNGAVYYDLDGQIHRLSYFDLGEYRVADWDGDGALEVISNMGRYQNGSSLNGTVIVEADGTVSRLNYYDAGSDYELLDLDGDGALEIFSTSASYLGGNPVGGAVYFDQSGAINRFTYNTLGNYKAVDVTGDGDLEIISTGDYYNPSAPVGGTVLYDSDGSMTRLNYFEIDHYDILDFDNDGQLELVTGSARYGSGAQVGGLVLFELVGDTDNFTRLAFGDFSDFSVADVNGDGWLDVVNQAEDGLAVHYYLQEALL